MNKNKILARIQELKLMLPTISIQGSGCAGGNGNREVEDELSRLYEYLKYCD